jgi:MtN3 and saliva related transmembrane protein
MILEITGAFGVIANISSNIAFVPQIIKSYKRKSVDDISIGMFLILFLTQICWIIYAIPIHANQLLISSAIEVILLTPIFIMWWKYSSLKRNKVHISDIPLEVISDT